MRLSGRLLGTASATALVLLGASPALAAGTQAGTSITNNVSVAYTVGGVAQTAATASNTFVVDRKVVLTVAGAASTTTVSPGQSAAVDTYTVTNSSNDTIDIALAVAQQAGGTAAHGGTDSFDTTGVTIYADTNGNGVYDPGTDQAITYLDEVAPDAVKTVFVVSNVPLSLANGAVSGNILTATAAAGGGAGSLGATLTATSGADTPGAVDTVLADAAGATDVAYDGKYSAKGDYTVAAPTLTVTKTEKVISDPVNNTTNPKAIPGATIEYCIIVANAAGSATANSVAITDPLPSTVTYSSGYGIFLNGTTTSGVCNTDGTAGGSYSAGTVSGNLGAVAANTNTTLRFRATIN